ncbi:hypothetical protein HAX54_021909, partial [Datura stramonium]|nr:hypothetical protein [Datura stramonium]
MEYQAAFDRLLDVNLSNENATLLLGTIKTRILSNENGISLLLRMIKTSNRINWCENSITKNLDEGIQLSSYKGRKLGKVLAFQSRISTVRKVVEVRLDSWNE